MMMIMFVAACASQGLEPASSAEKVTGMEDAARNSVDNVQMTVQTADWPGYAQIKEKLTPVRVIIKNQSGKPLRISYDQFALVAPDGKRFSALSPFQVDVKVDQKPLVVPPYGPIDSPLFGAESFMLAPMYSKLYPGMSPYNGMYGYNSYYDNPDYRKWREIQLPTKEMVDRALPEGVLLNGGMLDGYLYFEKVTDVPKVTYRADLVDAKNGRDFGEIRIPFVVD